MAKPSDYARFWSPAFDTMDDFIFLIDKNFNLVEVNKNFLAFAKKDRADLIGKRCHEIIHAADAPIGECPHSKTLETGKAQTGEFYDTNLKMWLRVTTTPIYDESGDLLGSIHIASDVTEENLKNDELKKKISDLERFQKITVDRELKMKELKARIAELEARIKKS